MNGLSSVVGPASEYDEPLENWELLTEIVVSLVSRPRQVRVEERLEGDASRFVVHVAPEDLGKVIGRNGETVSLLRKLFGRITMSRGRKVFIEIDEPGKTVLRRNSAA